MPDGDGEALDVASHSTLYAVGAYFCDRHPDLVDDVLGEAEAIERLGIRAWAAEEELSVQDAFETLVTGLGIRFYTALAGEPGLVTAPSDRP
ncbi:MAG: hypothetical protein M0P31_11730 [Solirubrobacteraceae bacterium]|nr:hypothetical protein [Solirubrobacteraceae bacterium]